MLIALKQCVYCNSNKKIIMNERQFFIEIWSQLKELVSTLNK